MKESDIQNYLYAHPEVLFPTGNITEKAKEYFIQGKRIDLLFAVDGVRHIVEIKNVPIQREHIGQVIEYYGLMKEYMRDAKLSMILVSSSIPSYRAVYLEELGIRCVEIPSVPETEDDIVRLSRDSITYDKKAKQKVEIKAALGNTVSITFEDIACPVNPRGIAFARRTLENSLIPIKEIYSEYDIVPFGITRASSADFDLEFDQTSNYGTDDFKKGGIWFAYRFGFSEEMPKNDVPNISIISNSAGIDVVLNAELQTSQKILVDRIQANLSQFNNLLVNHGKLYLKTYLKYEHQPRFYHWILADMKAPGSFDGETIIQIRRNHEEKFNDERKHWLHKIAADNKDITKPQIIHLEKQNKRLNMAIRLVEPYKSDAPIWKLTATEQLNELVDAVKRMKPLIDFFVK